MQITPFYVASRETYSNSTWKCKDVYSDKEFTEIAVAQAKDVEEAIKQGFSARSSMAQLKSYEKKKFFYILNVS